jgi:hypothetical protein
MGEKKSSKNLKQRNWAFFVYPESAPENWREQLKNRGLVCAISPLHDKDIVNETSEEEKKPHWHVLVNFNGPTTYSNVKSITDSLKQPIPEPINNMRGYYRYLTHKDDPDKYQYNEKDIETLNGFNISDYVEMTRSEKEAVKIVLINYIRENVIMEYAELIENLDDDEKFLELEIASNNTMFFDKYITSRRHRMFDASKEWTNEKDEIKQND